MVISFTVGTLAATATITAADQASNANTYFTGGAALCAILTFVGLPLLRALRKATAERRHQTTMLTAMHGAIFGTPQRVEGGVIVEAAAEGVQFEVANLKSSVARITATLETGTPLQTQIVAKLDGAIEVTTERLDQHETKIAEARRAAGEAATLAGRVDDRIAMLSERWWEWINDMQLRDEAHTAALHELGIHVGALPLPEGSDGAELHDR